MWVDVSSYLEIIISSQSKQNKSGFGNKCKSSNRMESNWMEQGWNMVRLQKSYVTEMYYAPVR